MPVFSPQRTVGLQGDRPVKWKLLTNLLLAAASTLICLAAGEAGARRFLPAPARADRSAIVEAREMERPDNRKVFGSLHRADPRIGWVLSPDPIHSHHRLVDDRGAVQYDVIYSVAGGARATSETPKSGPALIAAGCSFTFGHGLNDRDTWPWRLQENLPGYHVVNAGCMGYGTDQALMAAERQIRQNPGHTAAVVLGFGDFQIERNRAAQGWVVHVYPFGKPLFAVNRNEADFKRLVRFVTGGRLADYSDLFAHAVNAFANRAYGVPSREQARQLTADIILTYAKRFQAERIRLAVVTLPYLGDQFRDIRAEREFVVERLRAGGVPVLEPDFPRGKDGGIEGRDFMVSRIDRHPNAHYNALLTAQLLPFLKANGIAVP